MDLSVNNKNISNKNISFKGFETAYNKKGDKVFDLYVPPKYIQTLADDELIVVEYNRYKNSSEKPKKPIKLVHTNNGIVPIPLVKAFPKDSNKTSINTSQGFDGLLYRFRICKKVKFDINNPNLNEIDHVAEGPNGELYGIKFSNEDKIIYDETEKREVKNGDNKETFNIVKTSPNMGITPKAGTQYHVFLDSNIARQENPYRNAEFDFVHNHFNKLGGNIKGLDYLLTKTDELDPYRYIISNPDIGADPTSSHKYWPNNIYQCTDMKAFKDLNFHCFERGKGYVADGAFTSQSIQSPLLQHVYKWGEESPWFHMLKIDEKPEENLCIGVLPDNEEAMKHIGVKIVNNPRGKDYQRNKPSYIQFFDDRLVSIDSITKNELIKSTDKTPEDHYEITTNNDSVYMFSFEITPENTAQLDVFKKAGRNYVMLNEFKKEEDKTNFLKFKHFAIVNRHSASGATFWDGNRDMIKMNLSNAKNTEANENGMRDARQYIIGAATFWTETIQSDLILKTAKASDEEKAKIAENNEVDFDELKADLSAPDTEFPVLEQNKGISDYLREFPLQSIETSPELSAIFAQPDFNNELLGSKDFASKMETAVDSVLESVILKKFQKEQDKDFRNTELFKEYKQYAIKTFAPLIIKTLYAGALNKEAVSSNGELINEKLKDINLRRILVKKQCVPDSTKEERKYVIDEIRNGFTRSVLEGTKEKVYNELENVSLDDFKLADAIVSQGKCGLNWRFDAAKDVGDLDAVRDGRAEFKKIWEEITSFWTDFIANIRKYNPASLVINEITDLGPLIEKSEGIKGEAAFEKAKAIENQFLADSGSTTSSNYIFFFHKLACFVGTNTESNTDVFNNPKERAGNLDKLRDSIVDFMKQNQPGNVYFSHSFVENHDKPRVLHTLPLDIELFHSAKIEGNADYEKLAEELTGSKEYSKISPKALAVAQMMNKQIEKDYKGEEKEKLKEALAELTLGKKTKTSPASKKLSEAFGVAPYEKDSIRDLFEKAGLTDDLDDRILDFHSSMLSKAMSQKTSLWEMMNAIPGTPTIFNGAEFAQTGWEEKNKNETQANRNPILRSLRNDKRYKKYHDKMLAISGLYKLKGLSAIRDGAKEILNTVKEKEKEEKPFPKAFTDLSGERQYIIGGILRNGGYEAVQKFLEEHPTDEQSTYDALWKKFEIWNDKNCYDRFMAEVKNENFQKLLEACEDYPEIYKENEKIRKENAQALQLLPIYSYNKKGDEVLQFITNYNVPKGDLAYKAELESPKEKDAIFVKDIPLQEGTILRRKVYKSGMSFSDETTKNSKTAPQKYIVHNSTIYPAILKNGKYVADENKKININDTVLTFYKNKEDN